MAKQKKLYRLLYVDNYNQRPHIDLLVKAYNKPEAEMLGYQQIAAMAEEDVRFITEGAVALSKDVYKLSAAHFYHLVHGCWTLTECEIQFQVSKHVSKRSTEDVQRTADKRRKANGKKRRWSKAAKAARKARVDAEREAQRALALVS